MAATPANNTPSVLVGLIPPPASNLPGRPVQRTYNPLFDEPSANERLATQQAQQLRQSLSGTMRAMVSFLDNANSLITAAESSPVTAAVYAAQQIDLAEVKEFRDGIAAVVDNFKPTA